MDLGLDDRHVVVTGGSSGLGFATAAVLVAEGARVTLAARDADRLRAAATEIDDRAATVAVDITDRDAPATLMREAMAANGPIDGLVLSHGGPPTGRATDTNDRALTSAIEQALLGPVRVVRDVARTMRRNSAVVVVTSRSSRQPIPGLASSNLVRPAVWGFVKTLADELGPSGVRLNVVMPGSYDTVRRQEVEDDMALRRGATRAQVRAEAAGRIPLRRLGDPAEFGRVAAFLVSPAASYVTGAAWAVDGGALRGL